MKRPRKSDERPRSERAFNANKTKVRYAGRRWRLVEDRGEWLYIERRGVSKWIPAASAA